MTSSPGTASPELSDDERLLDLVRLIATRHPSALSTVQNAIEDAPYLAITTLSFLYRETCARNEHECSCHYENEYLTYITETGFDFEKFNHVARNVIRGVCRHARNDQNGLGLSSADSEISLLSLMSDKENNNAFQFNRQRRPISLSLSYETDNIVENKHRKLRQQNSDSSAVSVELDENRENRVHFKISPHGSLSSLAESQDSPSTPTRPKNFSPVSRQSSTGSHQSSVSEFEDDFRQSRLFKRRSSANFANPSLGRRRSSALRLMDVELDFIKLRTETSLLHVAAAVGDGSLLSFLMKTANASLLQIGAFQLSPLHLAILKKKMCYIKQIILNPDIRLAGSSGTFKFASRPVDKHGHKRHLESSKLSLIGLCVKMEDTETLRDLLNLGMFGDIALERGLKEAVENDSFAVVELLLQTGIRPSLDILKEGSSKSVDVFDCLFRRFRKDFKIYCLQHPDIVIRDLLMPSILIKNADVVRILVQNGIPLKQTKGFYSPVTCAVLDNQPEILTILLQNNADKSAEMQGYSLLDIACCMGFNECTGILKQYGVRKSRNIKSTVPTNLLMGIASKLDTTSDQAKLRRHLDHKRQGYEGDTVLHAAVKCKLSLTLMREILSLGSDVNAKNRKQETALMLAVSKDVNSPLEVIRELLYFNPALEQTDKSGKTTMNLAISRDFMTRSLVSKNGNMADSPESVASLLLDCGYNLKYDESKKSNNSVYALRTVWKDLAVTIGCGKDLNLKYRPKLLKELCRMSVRRSYPGIRLHKFLKFMKVPEEIKEFVLFTELLKVESDNYD